MLATYILHRYFNLIIKALILKMSYLTVYMHLASFQSFNIKTHKSGDGISAGRRQGGGCTPLFSA